MVSVLVKSLRYGSMWALFDDADYAIVKDLYWHIVQSHSGNYYIKTTTKINGKRKLVFAHRYLLGFPEKMIDHKDGNGLNNQRSNLRLATNHENGRNAKAQKNNTTGFKGVHLDKKSGRYFSVIVVDRKWITGREMFETPLRAAAKYNELALKHFGEFARLNIFSKEQSEELGKPYTRLRRWNGVKSRSGFCGVYEIVKNGKRVYRAEIYLEKGKKINLGYFKSAELAAIAYNEAAIRHKKSNAKLNIV